MKARITTLFLVFAVATGSTLGRPAAGLTSAAEEATELVNVGAVKLRVRVFRPRGNGPFPLAVVNYGSPPSASERPTMPLPTFASASDWLLAKGFLVALPLRRGYGATGGTWAEAYGACSNPDYYRAGLMTAEDIKATLTFFRARDDVVRERALVIGQSAGGWGSIALASTNPEGVEAVINFAGGRGGMQAKVGNCMPQHLIDAAGRYGATARLPTLWLYSLNDKFFSPELSRRMFEAFVGAGGHGEYIALPEFGANGHFIFTSPLGRKVWQPAVDGFLEKARSSKGR